MKTDSMPNSLVQYPIQLAFRNGTGTPRKLPQYDIGSRIAATGVLEMDWTPAAYQPLEVRLLLRSPSDIRLLALPPLRSRLPWVEIMGAVTLGF